MNDLDPALARQIKHGLIQRVPPNREHALKLLEQAEAHLASAASFVDTDPPGAYTLQYEAARKALTAVLAVRGIRVTSKGGHTSIYAAVRAGMTPEDKSTVKPFDRLRERRNAIAYLDEGVDDVTVEEVLQAAPVCKGIVRWASKQVPLTERTLSEPTNE